METILKEMCRRVKAKDVDFKKPSWFMEYSWTEKQQDSFEEWLTNFLMANKEARQEIMQWPRKDKKTCDKVAREFIFNYGWKNK
jgi:hypothetical protein